MSVTAFAHEVPDMEKTGSVSVAMTCEGKAVPGGTLTLYRVGDISEEDENYSFALTGGFAESRADLKELESAELPQILAEYAFEHHLPGTAASIGSDGKVVVDGLELGLYLVVQTEAAVGYEPVNPFVVSVPMNEDGAYVYDVDATPKMSLLTEKTTTPTTPTTPPEPTLPQTGQFNWPVPVMTVLGLCLLLIGWVLRYRKKGRSYAA